MFVYVLSFKLKNLFGYQDRSNGFAMLLIYHGMSSTAEEVIDELGQKPRKLKIIL